MVKSVPCAAIAACFLSSTVMIVAIAHAQTNSEAGESASPAASNELGEIIVTAEKRSTNLQRTPISITVLSGDLMQKEQVRTLEDITSLVPNFQMSETEGYPQITVRGVGITNFVPGAEGEVAVNLNEVYISRPIAQLTSLYDVSSIEVLRGPQGTLYGRNATAGSVNIATSKPTDVWSGYFRSTTGNYGLVNVEGGIGGPIIDDTLLFRIAGIRETRDGYGKNIVTGNDVDNKDNSGARITLVYRPNSNFKATLIGEWYKEHDNGASVHYFGAAGLTGLPGALGVPPTFVHFGGFSATNAYDVANGRDPKFYLRTTGVTGTLEWFRDAFSVKSISGYRDQSSHTGTPADGGSTDNGVFIAGEPAHSLSEELQAHYDTQTAHVTVGLYYFGENDNYLPASVIASNALLNYDFPTLPQRTGPGFVDFAEIGGLTKTTAKAAFVEGSYEVIKDLTITVGARYSRENKQLFQRYGVDLYKPYTADTAPPPEIAIPPRTFVSTTPKAGIQYQIDSQTLLYFTYAQGFKSGGFDPGSAPAVAYQPEKLSDYEGGVKTTLFDNRLRLGLSGFYYNYTDLQVQEIVGVTVATTNAATAKIYGSEVEVSAALTDALTLDATGSFLHARYGHYAGPDAARPLIPVVDFSGNELNNAPDWRAHLGLSYRWNVRDGNVVLRGEGDYSSKFYFSAANIPLMGQSAFAKENGFLTYNISNGWYLTAFARNITGKVTRVSAEIFSPIIGNLWSVPMRHRAPMG
jgi:iron complex outermembrane receptor protein